MGCRRVIDFVYAAPSSPTTRHPTPHHTTSSHILSKLPILTTIGLPDHAITLRLSNPRKTADIIAGCHVPTNMDTRLAYYQARLATFQGAPTKSRRSSSRSKKAAPKSKVAWPLSAPSAEDLASAGFVWKPTSSSPDNVQCWSCNCQLDGWEESDVPAYEHLTHSPTCGFAVCTAIRLRHGDPARTEDNPTSDAMVAARKDTFSDLWPLDTAAGFPSVDQLAAAGWFYDPTDDTPDGVTCPYCHLSLDAWDEGDDPLEEHRRRAPNCLFFFLSEMYHPPANPEPNKAKRTTKRASTTKQASTTKRPAAAAKRISTRSSSASIISSAPTTRATRGTKRTSEAIDDTIEIKVSKLTVFESRQVLTSCTE